MTDVARLEYSSIDIASDNRPIDSNGNQTALFAVCEPVLMWLFYIHAGEIDRLCIAKASRLTACF
jgi:hypothetical protein